MKRFFHLMVVALAAVPLLSDCRKYDESELKNESQELREGLSAAVVAGRDSTIDMMAKPGCSSRLGERSRGVIDAGPALCGLLLNTMADAAKELLGA